MAGFSATSENIYQGADTAADMFFDRAFRQTQLLRGFALRQSVDFAQDENFTAFGRQLVDRLRHQPELLALFGLHVRRQNPGFDAQPIDLGQRLHRDDRRAPYFGNDDRQRRTKEIGAWIFDMVDRRQGRELRIGFLHDIIEQKAILHAPRQPAAQRWFMRTDVACQPYGSAIQNRSTPYIDDRL